MKALNAVMARSERVYDRDAVLGRDATSVFPTEIAASAAADRSAAAEAIGGRTFITETEVNTQVHDPTLYAWSTCLHLQKALCSVYLVI
jgi:hypothetical protein